MDYEYDKRMICNGCIHNFVIDKELNGERFMFVYCDLTLWFAYSIHLPEHELIDEGHTCGGKNFERRPIWEVH